ncbi:ultraviolet-B receptor UVR8 isoform B [Chlorella sorokiniana]|uniref:Ultraviolet-B receptor UVR8 isoform B n=1 Tax=Chlorella sorokiniana TaxID=3076 RepID=A0A2P6TXF0_CHLSO|nr:ultraviolet-B receptor UVR8 isoform B [Chlorella sorokiniana]|eukprot:PRW58731.1 ultraviolet-B receptor UVR8 isoform B [Chlorella sorokiniana]
MQAARSVAISLLEGSRAFSAAVAAQAAGPTVTLSWGVGQQGALGIHSTRDQHEPEEIPDLPNNIAALGAGHYSSFACTAEGQLWSWGRNNEGQLGRPLAENEFGCSPVPRPVDALSAHHIVTATGSGVASFGLTKQGGLLAWGTSKRGQLGLGAGITRAEQPRQLHLPAAVVHMSAGWGHAAALLEDNSVWTWGWPASGRLGHSFAADAADEEEQRLMERCCWEPRRLELLQGAVVRQVVCGFDHTLVLAQDGSLFTFGDNSLCQLGRPSQGEAMQPRDATAWLINPDFDCGRRIRFRKVAAGLGHCLGVLADGSTVSWGWNSAGQCGLGQFVTEECVERPTPIYGIPTNRHALITAGRVHSVLITDEVSERTSAFEAQGVGRTQLTMCHSWGSAQAGRLGSGMYEDALFPELVPDLDGEHIVDVACGLDHTLVLGLERC